MLELEFWLEFDETLQLAALASSDLPHRQEKEVAVMIRLIPFVFTYTVHKLLTSLKRDQDHCTVENFKGRYDATASQVFVGT